MHATKSKIPNRLSAHSNPQNGVKQIVKKSQEKCKKAARQDSYFSNRETGDHCRR